VKRLVVCCDGTWNKPDSQNITNVEKFARTVQGDPGATGGDHQLVYYISGVGAGSYAADRLLGGAFGFGLFHNVIACYRFLAQNYEPDDEIFIIGFSRGAYTARSVAGMLARVGLLTRLSLVEERLGTAVRLYQQVEMLEGAFGESVEEFKHDHCHAAKVDFLGVFDTVGALGVPGFQRLAPRFHNVQLGSQVRRARHALAIDETRLKFAPTFWEIPEDHPEASTEDERVKQVWFEGAHSDVGGGYRETGLSDTSLLWMVREAHQAGLVFDAPLLNHYVNSGADPIRHNPLNAMYRVDNLYLRAKGKVRRPARPSPFSGGLRRLSSDRALSVRIASSAVHHFQEGGYEPANVGAYASETSGFTDRIEPVTALPEAGVDLVALGEPPAGEAGA
jgi:T6SS, Phospholipase effector Tle1-like, catalytic domain